MALLDNLPNLAKYSGLGTLAPIAAVGNSLVGAFGQGAPATGPVNTDFIKGKSNPATIADQSNVKTTYGASNFAAPQQQTALSALPQLQAPQAFSSSSGGSNPAYTTPTASPNAISAGYDQQRQFQLDSANDLLKLAYQGTGGDGQLAANKLSYLTHMFGNNNNFGQLQEQQSAVNANNARGLDEQSLSQAGQNARNAESNASALQQAGLREAGALQQTDLQQSGALQREQLGQLGQSQRNAASLANTRELESLKSQPISTSYISGPGGVQYPVTNQGLITRDANNKTVVTPIGAAEDRAKTAIPESVKVGAKTSQADGTYSLPDGRKLTANQGVITEIK